MDKSGASNVKEKYVTIAVKIIYKGVKAMYFLDANAWYWYFGRDELGLESTQNIDKQRLTRDLDRISNKSIPASVYIEVVTRFRDEPNKLQKLLKHRYEKEMPIFNNIPDYIITPEELQFTAIIGHKELTEYAYKVLEKKIDIEMKFIYSFLEIMRLLFLQFVLDSKFELAGEQKEHILQWFGKVNSIDSREKKKKELKDALIDGYKIKNEKKVIKDKYIEMLNEECLFEKMIVEGCIACLNDANDIISVIQNVYRLAVKNGLDGKDGTMKYIDNVLSNNPTFLVKAKGKIAAMFSKTSYKKMSYTKEQSNYLEEIMFDAWMEREQKLRKNDIFDMLCVGVLDHKESINRSCLLMDNETYLISFDKTMKKFICSHSASSARFISRYEI